MLKIAFDIGGVLCKYPDQFKILLQALKDSVDIKLYIITDMNHESAILKLNEFGYLDYFEYNNIYSADYSKYDQKCKSVLCKDLGIDILIDDYIDYVYENPTIGLLVMPRPNINYEKLL